MLVADSADKEVVVNDACSGMEIEIERIYIDELGDGESVDGLTVRSNMFVETRGERAHRGPWMGLSWWQGRQYQIVRSHPSIRHFATSTPS